SWSPKTRANDVGEELIDAVVIEPEAVDQRLGAWYPKHPRLGIARLRSRSHGAAFDETEPECRQAVDMSGVLVQARGKSDTVWKRESHQLNRRGGGLRRESLRDAKRRCQVERRKRELVRRLRVELEQQRTESWVEHR